MKNRKDDPASRPDEDNPEWTRADIKKARPALDAVAEVFGEQARGTVSGQRTPAQGRPQGQPDAAHRRGRAGSLPAGRQRLADAHQRSPTPAHAAAPQVRVERR